MEKENLSPQESLALIQNMIAKTRSDMGKNSAYFLLWGWVTFVACMGQFLLYKVFDYPKHYLVWWLIVPAAIISAYMGFKQDRTRKATTYVGDSMKFLWTGMGISYFVLSMIFAKMGWGNNIFPFFIMLYGLGTFVSGKLLQFKPLVVGALVAWVLAIVAAYLPNEYQLLCGAGAIMVSYIIPAHLLRLKKG